MPRRENAREGGRFARSFIELLERRLFLSGGGTVEPAAPGGLGAPIFDAALGGVGPVNSVPILSISESDTTVTVVTTAGNTLTPGQSVTIYDVAPAGYSITATVLSVGSTNQANDTFTYAASGSLGPAVAGREACATVGESQLGEVFGTLNKYPYGPYKIGDSTPGNFGWSATGTGYSTWDLDAGPGVNASASNTANGGLIVGDFFLGGISTDGTVGREIYLMQYGLTNGAMVAALAVDGNRQISLISSFGAWQLNLAPLPNMGWIELALGLTHGTGNGVQNIAAYYRLPGQTAYTQLGTTETISEYSEGADLASIGQQQQSSQIFFNSFRLGRPRLYSIASLSDVVAPTGYVDGPSPVNAVSGIVAYMNPATGSDSNDGATPETPIKTLAEFNLRSQDGGFLPVDPIENSTPGCGTLLVIDTSEAPVVTAGTSMLIQTAGMKIAPPAGQDSIVIDNDEVMSSDSFSPLLVHGVTIYQSGDVDTSQTDFIWQNGVPLTRAASAAACAMTAGTFYNASATAVYVNPLNGDVPTAGTSVYQRSYNIADAYLSAVIMASDLVEVDDFSSDGTATNVNGAYCIQDQTPQLGMLSPVVNFVGAYKPDLRTVISGGEFGAQLGSDKHSIGETFATTDGSFVVQNVDIGPSLPGGTPMVNYTGQNPAPSGATALWSQIRLPVNEIIGGSSAGGQGNAAWTAHGNASDNFASIGFDAVDAPGGAFYDQGISQLLYFQNGCVTGAISSNDPTTTISDCTVSSSVGAPIGAENPQGTFSVMDSILVDSTNYNGFGPAKLSGAITLVGDTIDLSGTSNLGGGNFIWDASQATSITLRDCVIIGNGSDLHLFNGIPAGCTVVSDDNEWDVSPSTVIATNYKGGGSKTLSQWQGLGFDRQSGINGVNGFVSPVTAASAPLYMPSGPGIRTYDRGAGSDRYTGVQYDFYGNPLPITIFADRNDPGAVQYAPGSPTTTSAAANYWTGANGISFNNPNNWSQGIVPSGGMPAIVNSGTVLISSGCSVANLTINGGVVDWMGGVISGGVNIGAGGTLDIIGGGAMTMNAAVSNAGVIEQNSVASTTFQSLFTNAGRVQINDGTVILNTFINGYGMLSVGGATTNGIVDLAAVGGYDLLSSLTVAPGSTMDIADNTVEIDFGSAVNDPLAGLRQALRAGYFGGLWTGAGLTSSTVAAQVAGARRNGGGVWAIGYVDGNLDPGQTVAAANQFVIEPQLQGDVNWSGSTNFLDLGRVAQNLGSINADWEHGDLNYDGQVNFLDIGLVAQNLSDTTINTPLTPVVPGAAAVAATDLAISPENQSKSAPNPPTQTIAGAAGASPLIGVWIAPASSDGLLFGDGDAGAIGGVLD